MTSAIAAWHALGDIPDPELPAVSIVELGIVRDVTCTDNECIVTLTPTYTGCPAMRAIEADVRSALAKVTSAPPRIATVLTPPWSSDWIAPEAREELARNGIAPPARVVQWSEPPQSAVQCPNCGSSSTEELSRFGSTACKAQYRCADCREPFDYVKAH
ncbi:MAG TPA: 1,2-phenylacetyl-CoA epoxidase subunit PaaD [Casimicrobiaceae bacterium]|nr:1,2-phenylacetyl-CoA epoxidase subunit PaaD [Casimicrobiaceae bacterium]